jgi:hypothetical protein
MSGNSTRMGVSLADAHWQSAAEAFGLIVLFVIGAAAGSLIVLGRGANRQAAVLLAARRRGDRLQVRAVECRDCSDRAGDGPGGSWINLDAIWFAAGITLSLCGMVVVTARRH